MQKLVRLTKRRFIALTILLVCAVVALSWGILQMVNVNHIGVEAKIDDVHQSAENNPALAEYLQAQQAYEAHFVSLATSVRQEDQARLTRALAFSSIAVIVIGGGLAVLIANRLMKPVEEAYASQERFLQDAAHELRNPLATMAIALQQAEKKGEKSPTLAVMKRQTRRLIHINEDLLFLERQRNQEPADTNISTLLEDIIEEMQPMATAQRVQLKTVAGSNIMKRIAPADYVRLVKNILDNAIKYSKPKGIVSVKQAASKHEITITITDTGIGIPKEDLPAIGKRFYRAKNTGTIDGTGLGMAIVQKILNIYGGDIEITSTVNKGTTVTLVLPA